MPSFWDIISAIGSHLGVPREDIRNAQGEVVFPTNALERGLQASDATAGQYAAAFMGPGAKGAFGMTRRWRPEELPATANSNTNVTYFQPASAPSAPPAGPASVSSLDAAKMANIRKQNISDVFSGGGGVISELDNGWMIGKLPGSKSSVSHVLLSPQGSPALYGSSATDLIRRGFHPQDVGTGIRGQPGIPRSLWGSVPYPE